jgi:hypothetical protein
MKSGFAPRPEHESARGTPAPPYLHNEAIPRIAVR